MWTLWSNPPIAKIRRPSCSGNTASESETIGFKPTERECKQETLQLPAQDKQNNLSGMTEHTFRSFKIMQTDRIWLIKFALEAD
jgi:hypothetical protein